MKILLLDTGTQGLVIAQSLHKLGHIIGLLYCEKNNYADLSNVIDIKHFFDSKLRDIRYLNYFRECLISQQYDVVIPMSDISAEFLSRYISEIQLYTNVKMPIYDNFLKGYDKNSLMKLCEKRKYPHPKTIDLSVYGDNIEHLKELKEFPYPAILKPNLTTGGRGMKIVSNYNELLKIYPNNREKYGECHLQKFISKGGRQLKIQLYIDEQKTLIASSVLNKVRWYPVKGGSSCCSLSIYDENLVNICFNILKDIDWVGFADFDVIEDPDSKELLIMEINPRVPACIKCAIEAGVNWSEIIVNGYTNQEQNKYKYREGVSLRHIGLDFLWFIKSPNRFKTIPSWFRFFGKNVVFQDFCFYDQKPFWVGTFTNIKKLFDKEFKIEKQGI